MSKSPVIVGLIYAEWCGHCNALKPDWKKLEGEMKNNPDISVIKIDEADPTKNDKMREINQELVAEGYPTIFKVNNGKVEYFQGDRTFDELNKWSRNGVKTGGCGCGLFGKKSRKSKRRKTSTKKRRRSTKKRRYFTKN